MLKQHFENEHRSVAYMCSECARSFRTMRALVSHQLQKHMLPIPTMDATVTTQPEAKQLITCSMCNLTFET
jgi:protein-arginine kinase activator protein McsA